MGYQETIKRCSNMMQSVEILQGSSQHIRYPLLSVFAGEDAVQNVEVVKNVYRKCWMPEVLDAIPFVVREKLGENDVTDNVKAALTHRPEINEYNVFYQVFYWDIMDSVFEYNFQVLQRKPRVPITYEVRRIFFLFARMSSDSSVAEERCERLINWAKENNEHIFILTDATKDGYLGPEQLAENYQMAADITVICNSKSNDNRSLQLGFDLMKNNVYSAGYYSQGKNTRQIVAASIVSMLDFYRSAMQQNTSEIAGNIENYLGNYISIFEKVFEKLFLPAMPKETSFYRYLDFTPQMEEFYRSFQTGERRKLGFGIGRPHSEQGADLAAASRAKKSVDPFWQAILDQYYLSAVSSFFQSDSDGETGEDRLRYELRSVLTSKFSYHQLMSVTVNEEIIRLRNMTQKDIEAALPRVKNAITPESFFAQEAIRDVKLAVYREFYRILSEELEKLYLNAGSFSEKIDIIRNYYKEIVKDESISEAYRNVVAKECASKPEYVKGMISPCKDVEELLEQIERVFYTFTKDIKEYHLSFADELKWRMNAPGGGAMDEVISAAFAKDVTSTARLSAFEGISGKMYSLMKESDVPVDIINAELLGEIFDMPQSDQLERLLVYTLDSLNIMWV